MMGKKIYRKKWRIMFVVSLMFCYLFMPTAYTSAATGDVTSAMANQQAVAKLSETKATVVIGNTLTLTVKNLDDSKVSSVKWKANRPSIAKVSQEGVVTPVKVGTTTIKCIITYKDKTEQTLSCTVTVRNRVKATKVTITNKSVSLQVGKTVVLKTKLSPANTTDQVYWFTSDKTVATVGLTSGKVTAKKAGTVVITAKVGKDRKDAGAKTNKVVAKISVEVTSKNGSKKSTDESFFEWRVEENGIAITGYKEGLPENVVIPEKINGVAVKSIAYPAFYGCTDLKSVSIPEGVTSIGNSAFYECSNLASVTIPEGVTSIGWRAFGNCSSLKEVTIPEGVTTIQSSMFSYCGSLERVTIPKSVTEIEDGAFWHCGSLKEISIPKGVTSIGGWAFRGCNSLTSVTIPEGVTSIGNEAFSDCSNLASVTISEGIMSIGWRAFYDCSNLASITIPEGVTNIENAVFSGCKSLESVTIPQGVTSIGDHAFYDCSNLASVIIPEGVTSIGEFAFSGCSNLVSVAILESVTSIGNCAFSGCSNLVSVTIPESVTSIGDFSFGFCNRLIIYGASGSYAEQYAKEKNIPFQLQ